VTVLASTAAEADAAATMIANRVDLPGSSRIGRTPASELTPDSDLGSRPVTTHVGALTPSETRTALDAGERTARNYRSRGLLCAAYIGLSGDYRAITDTQEQITDYREAACA